MSDLAITAIVILLWIGGLAGFGVGRFFRLRATYKGRRQAEVFPPDRNVRGFEIPKSWHGKNGEEIPF